MKKTLSLVFLSVLMFLVFSGYSGGCATYGNTDKSDVDEPIVEEPTVVIKRGSPLKIISDPPGAVIEFNNMYIGKTPLTAVVNDYCKYCFDCSAVKTGDIDVCGSIVGLNVNMLNIKATPTKKGYVQEKNITCSQFFEGGTVYFNMDLVPASETNK